MAPAKPAPQASSAPTSVMGAMKKHARLNKHLAQSKKVVAVREFQGPDGDYNCKLTRISNITREGVLSVIFEYRVLDEGEYIDQKITVWFNFKDEEVGLQRKLEEIQDEFFMTLQLMGIETEGATDDAIDKGLDNLVKTEEPIIISVNTTTSKKTGKKYKNFKVKGLGSAAEEIEGTEYQEVVDDETEYQDSAEVVSEEDDTPISDEPVDDWDDIPAEEEDAEEVPDAEPPSAWVGYAMIYKGEEVEVLQADDKAMICIVKAGNKKLKVPFEKLSPPPE